jgi:nitrogenase subunit NifH
MKLQTKASSGQQFVAQQNIPAESAFSDSNVILAAFIEALESLLILCDTPTDSETILTSMYQNYSTLHQMRDQFKEDMLRADVMLEAISVKLSL